MIDTLEVRDIYKNEQQQLGQLLIGVYSDLDGFPTRDEQPAYYEMLANIGNFTTQKETRVLVALSPKGELVGGVVYFGDMSNYGSGGTATTVKNASGIRLLGIDPVFRQQGAGKALTQACILLAKNKGHPQVVLHTTGAMQMAFKMYEKLGFKRSPDLDFSQQNLPVFGFRLQLVD